MGSENGCQPKAAARSSTGAAQKGGNASPCKKLSPPASLKSGKRIKEILKNGGRAGGRLMSLLYMDRGENGGARFATLVPKRCGGAAGRNRIKRILRETFRLAEGFQDSSMDVVACWRAEINEETAAGAGKEFLRLMKKAGIRK